ncbi:MAG: CoA-binding protein [Promethearchaeota archaeon]|jgi:acyl-CoA synthetase (NDP forming)
MDIEEKLDLMKILFNPKNVAIIGATNQMMKIGAFVMTSVLSCGFKKKIYGINPNPKYVNKKVFGSDMYPTLDKCPEQIDLVGIVVPPNAVLDSIKQAIENDVRTAAIITAGFGEVKAEERQIINQEIVKVADKGGLIFVGPNSMGFYSSEDKASPLHLGFGFMIPKPGNLSIVSQSGTMGTILCNSSPYIRYFVSSGNEASLILEDYLEYYARDEETKTIALFAEGLRAGSRFKEICSEITKKKPILFLKAGQTETGARAANSHTGSIAGSLDIYKSVFKQTGVIYAENIEQFLYLIKGAQYLLPLPNKDRLRAGILSGGGGFVVHLTDLCEKHGINVVDLNTEPNGPKLIKQISEYLPFYWSHNNPVDMVATRNPNAYQNVMKLMLESDCFDAILTMTSITFIERMSMLEPINQYGKKMKEMMSMRRSERLEEVMQREIDVAHNYPDKKLVYITFSSSLGNPIYRKFDENKVMVLGGNPENAPIVLKKLHEYQKFVSKD